MIEPIVTLIPVKFGSQNYTILGKVIKSGIYPVSEGTKVLDSIADAGGLLTGARLESRAGVARLR